MHLRRAEDRFRSSPWELGSPSTKAHSQAHKLKKQSEQLYQYPTRPQMIRRTIVRPPLLVGRRSQGVRTVGAIGAHPDPRGERRSLAASMRELYSDLGRLRVSKVDYALKRRDLRVRPQTGVLGRDAAFGNNRGRLHDDGAGPARRKALSARSKLW